MATVSFQQATRIYPGGDKPAVDKLELEIGDGEFMVLVGPSGCGKSTSLRMLAGLEEVNEGKIFIGDRDVTDLPPKDRDIAMVFQNYALYPHMTVADNMGFALKMAGIPKVERDTRVMEAAKLLGLEEFLARKPKALSGGQRQRVAMGRAIVRQPQVFLMDEPLSNLDAKLRVSTRTQISALVTRLGVTTVYVTHDQTEALTMSDRIAVFDQGTVQQCAPPNVLYERPANLFVADFIGESNKLRGAIEAVDDGSVRVRLEDGGLVSALKVDCCAVGQPTTVSIRPEKLTFTEHLGDTGNRIRARFVSRHYVGEYIRYHFETANGSELVVKNMNDSSAPRLAPGDEIALAWLPQDSQALDGQEAPKPL